MILRSTGEVAMEHGQRIVGSEFRFAGTGAEHAYECWTSNKNPKLAVVSAQSKDPFSGGAVKFFNRNDGGNNLGNGVEFSSVAELFLQKGMVMYTGNNLALTVGEAARKDPRIAELVKEVENGGLAAEAPSGLDPVVWTKDDEARLDAALSKHYGSTK